MSLPSDINVAIIGAGAAGLGAAHALKDSGLSFIVLEARDRVGGRGHTIMASPEVTFDLGCGWLHSANRNSFVKVAEALGFPVDPTLPPSRDRGLLRPPRASRQTGRQQWPRLCRREMSRARQSLESDDRRDLDLCERL